jgi:NAD(P)H-hydrate epimerase
VNLPAVRDVPSVTAAQMAEIDRIADAEFAMGTELLMENASRQIAAAARAFLGGRLAGKHVVGLVGPGNNGGDAAGALRHLANWGANVLALVGAEQERLRDTTRVQISRLLMATTHQTAIVKNATRMKSVTIEGADLVLDGLLGFSAKGAPRDAIAILADAANGSGIPILAVDLPSGLDADAGAAPGAVVRAVATVTLALPKTGLLAPAASRYVGELVLADIGVPHLAFAKLGLDTTRLFLENDLVRVVR